MVWCGCGLIRGRWVVDQSPVLDVDYLVAYQGSSVGFTTGRLLVNDYDPQEQPLTVVAVSEPGVDGVLSGSLGSGFTYTPGADPSLVGSDQSIEYLAVDPDGHVAQQSIVIRILAAGDPNRVPVTGDDVALTGPANTVSVFVVDNDFDPDGDSLAVAEVVDPAHGRVAFGPNFVNYTPDVGFAGMETFTYTVRDSQGLVADGVVRVWVDSGSLGGDQSPVLDVDYLVAYQGSSVGFTTGRLLVNDYDPQEQPLTVVAVSEPGVDGVLSGSLGSGFTYTPGADPSLVGSDQSIEYLAVDPDGHVAQQSIVIRILAAGDPNRVPVTGDDVALTGPANTVSVFVVDNDFDPDGDSLAVAEVVDPAHGRVAFGPNFVNYTPDVGFAGMETFTYTVRDSQGLVADGVVRVWVDSGSLGGDQSPVLDVDYLVAYQGSSVGFTTGRLLVNDYDPQEQPLTVVAVSEPGVDGVLSGSLGSGFTYTPGADPSLVGSDQSIEYLAVDPDGHVAQQSIVIRILAAGDPNRVPVAVPDSGSTTGGTVSLFVTSNDFDPDGDSLAVAEVVDPAHGRVAFGPNFVNYTPDVGFAGMETFTYTGVTRTVSWPTGWWWSGST